MVPAFFGDSTLRTFVYIDALNLYYGPLRKSPFRWLDLQKLCQLMLPKNDIQAIKYFTALVSARPGDADQPLRQQLYIRALKTIPNIEIIYGHYLTHVVRMPQDTPPGAKQEYVQVIKTEEKGWDVNLAPIQLIRSQLSKKVGVLNPQKNPSRAILPHVDFFKQIRSGVLRDSQFPDTLTDPHGTITKPTRWR